MHRMTSSWSSSSSGSASSFFFDLPFEDFCLVAGVVAGESSSVSLVWWPLPARPDRRGSSVYRVSDLVDKDACQGAVMRTRLGMADDDAPRDLAYQP